MKVKKLLSALVLISIAVSVMTFLLLMRNSRYSGEAILSWNNFVDALPTLGLMVAAITVVAIFYKGPAD